MKTSVVLKYKGPALDDGRMDVYEASANMIAFSEFMVAVVKSAYGDGAEAKAEVAGFERGSFQTDLVIHVGGTLATVFATVSPGQLWSVVKDAFRVWKHLKGEPPKQVSFDKSHHATVTNNNGHIIQVHTDSLNLVMSDLGSTPVRRFVKDALEREGVTSLEIQGEDKEIIAQVSEAESSYFVPVSPETVVSDNTNRMVVTLVSPVFQDGNKWRFHDGASAFAAAILDQSFLASVNAGERFGKGDVLDVDMRIVQTRTHMKVALEREVLKVHKHLTPHEQITMH